MDYSTQKMSQKLMEEIQEALQSLEYGSVEIYVQNETVTQITIRNIKKTGASSNGHKKNGVNGKFKNEKFNYDDFRVLTIKK